MGFERALYFTLNILLRVVKTLELDARSLMDSAGVGALAKFLEEACLASFSRSLNLCATQVVTVSNAQSVIKEVSSAFRSSAKHTDLLKRCIRRAPETTTNKRHLTTLCTTRFRAVVTLRTLLPYVVEALVEMRR